MVLASISLENDGDTIVREMAEAVEEEKRAWDFARRTLVEVFNINPDELVEHTNQQHDERSIYRYGQEMYSQKTMRFPEKVIVVSEWHFIAELPRRFR